jgi:RecA-family ATPase
MQLAVAHVIGGDWLCSLPAPGPALYFNAEDDEQELHRRLAAIAKHAGCGLNDLAGLHLITRAGKDAVLGALDRNGIIKPTPLFVALHDKACRIRPQIVIVDTAADIFAGNENDRAQVRQFIGLLRGLAIDANCGVLMVSHPSLTGISTGSGSSGSTGWVNSVRSRLYFRAANDKTSDEAGDDAPETGMRELVIKKNNYGPSGETIRLYYDGGVFKPVSSPSSLERAAAEQKAERLFMALFDRLTDQGRSFSPSKYSPENYPPKVFAAHPDGKGIGIKASEAAMQRLLDAGKIRIDNVGKPSQPRQILVRV